MESDLLHAVEIGTNAVAEDFSLWGLFLQADIIVKAVMVVLSRWAVLMSQCSVWNSAINYCQR